MSSLLDMVRDVVNAVLPPLVADTYTVTVLAGNGTAYTIQGTPTDDIESARESGLTVQENDDVVILYQKTAPTLTGIDPGDWLTGPSDANNRSSRVAIINSIVVDPANATWTVAAGT